MLCAGAVLWIYCRLSQALWRLHVPECFPWLELNGLFAFCAQKTHSPIQPEFGSLLFLISCVWYKLSYNPVYIESNLSSSYPLAVFRSKTCRKLKSRLWFELLHSALQPTSLTDNKQLFFCITFLPLWPNLTPCSAFSQHTSIISALFHRDQIWHSLPENPQL